MNIAIWISLILLFIIGVYIGYSTNPLHCAKFQTNTVVADYSEEDVAWAIANYNAGYDPRGYVSRCGRDFEPSGKPIKRRQNDIRYA